MLQKEIAPKQNRWFIWAIVALLVSGISLVSYIMVSSVDVEADNYQVVNN